MFLILLALLRFRFDKKHIHFVIFATRENNFNVPMKHASYMENYKIIKTQPPVQTHGTVQHERMVVPWDKKN